MMLTKLRLVVLSVLLFAVLCKAQDTEEVVNDGPIVTTTLGQVRGVRVEDGDYIGYMGIPYGIVNPNNPFGESLDTPPFEGIFEANDDSAICPQEEEFNYTIVGTLDCLHVNVYVPASATPTNLLPVMVWIYGGGWTIGFAGRHVYGPKFLVRHDVIFVTLNYRIGPYGFMCTDHPEIPGNVGLKDQLKAMRWVKQNIQAFGGDPNAITLAGNSAGSMSVDHHIIRPSNEPEPLFHQAILQSGTAMVQKTSEAPIDGPFQICRYLGYEASDINDAIAYLAAIPPLSLIRTVLDMEMPFDVCIEREFEGHEAFVTESWKRLPRDLPTIRDMPILMGFVRNETGVRFYSGIQNPNLVPDYLAENLDSTNENFTQIADIVYRYFFAENALTFDMIPEADEFGSDIEFVYGIHRVFRNYLDNGASKVYLYQFSVDSVRNYVKDRNNFEFVGTLHADELGYLFDISYMDEPSPEDQLVIDRMSEMWANFIKYGDPTPSTSELLPHQWLPITRGSPYHYLEITNTDLLIGKRIHRERLAFWDLMYYLNSHMVLEEV